MRLLDFGHFVWQGNVRHKECRKKVSGYIDSGHNDNRQEDTTEEEQVHSHAEDDGGEAIRSRKTDGTASNGVTGAADEPDQF